MKGKNEPFKKKIGRGKMVKGKIVLSVLGVLLGIVFLVSLSYVPRAIAAEELVLAHASPMTGAAASWGINIERGFSMFASEINSAGGLKIGDRVYKVKPVAYDTRYEPSSGVSIATRAGAMGIKYLSVLGGALVNACQPILEKNKILNLGEFAGGVEYTNPKSPYTFRSMPCSEQVAAACYPELVKMWGPLRIACINVEQDVMRRAQEEDERTAKKLGLPVEFVGIESFVRGTVDFRAIFTKLNALKPNCWRLGGSPGEVPLMAKQLDELGYSGHKYTFQQAQDVEALKKTLSKEAIEGYVTERYWVKGSGPKRFQEFYNRYVRAYGDSPNPVVYEQYAGLEMLIQAMKKVGSIDSEKVAKALREVEMETILGPSWVGGPEYGFGIKNQLVYGIPLLEFKGGEPVITAVAMPKKH
jgi:branched-chain amino acid transport system substrate-binding protein